MTDKPKLNSFVFYDNTYGWVDFEINDKHHRYWFNCDACAIISMIRGEMKYRPFSALNIARKQAYKEEVL